MNTPTQEVARIITHRLNWEVVDSNGNPAAKPSGQNELITLLSAHKAGLNIVAGEPGAPQVVTVWMEEAPVHYSVKCPPGIVVEFKDRSDGQ